MWADAKRDGRPAEYRWRPLLNVVDQFWLTSVKRRRCSNEAKMQNPLKFAGLTQTRQWISAASGPKFTTL